jgi:hypothetical protein
MAAAAGQFDGCCVPIPELTHMHFIILKEMALLSRGESYVEVE